MRGNLLDFGKKKRQKKNLTALAVIFGVIVLIIGAIATLSSCSYCYGEDDAF